MSDETTKPPETAVSAGTACSPSFVFPKLIGPHASKDEYQQTQCCASCRFWVMGDTPERFEMGRCRRYPPTIEPRIRDAVVRGVDDDQTVCETEADELAIGSFPVTGMEEWCGEWAAR